MRPPPFVVALLLGGLVLGACGSSQPRAYAPSKNCRVSETNIDYAGCDLAHQNLSGLDLQDDNFRRANLTDVNLDGSNLQGADLAGAVTLGAKTDSSTVCSNTVFGPCTRSQLRGKGVYHGGS